MSYLLVLPTLLLPVEAGGGWVARVFMETQVQTRLNLVTQGFASEKERAERREVGSHAAVVHTGVTEPRDRISDGPQQQQRA